ncbi:MAG: hypothetical protein ACPGQL_03770 [Thermoplasmatota archaeon]
MDRDERVRESLLITGGLLALYSLIGILYAEGIRGDSGVCGDGGRVLVNDQCVRAWLLLMIPLVAGTILLVIAFSKYGRHKGEAADVGELGPGTGSRFTLAFLGSLFVVTLISYIVQSARTINDEVRYYLEIGGLQYAHATLLLVACVVSLLIFVPYLLLYRRQQAKVERFTAARRDAQSKRFPGERQEEAKEEIPTIHLHARDEVLDASRLDPRNQR